MKGTRVDTRQLKSGQVRLRFRLSDEAHNLVSDALSMTPYDYSNAALDAIAMNFHAGGPAVAPLGIPATGSKRLLVRLYPDQYENVRSALDYAHEWVDTDAEGLLLICSSFVAEHLDDFSFVSVHHPGKHELKSCIQLQNS